MRRLSTRRAGVDCPDYQPWPGKLGMCKRCTKTVGEHAGGTKLTFSKQGVCARPRVCVARFHAPLCVSQAPR